MNKKYSIKKETIQPYTVVHCPEKWMAKLFLHAADRMGLEWCNFVSYKKETFWEEYRNKTCYELSDGTYSEIDFYIENNYKIIPFWDAVDLGFKSRLISLIYFLHNWPKKKISLIRRKIN